MDRVQDELGRHGGCEQRELELAANARHRRDIRTAPLNQDAIHTHQLQLTFDYHHTQTIQSCLHENLCGTVMRCLRQDPFDLKYAHYTYIVPCGDAPTHGQLARVQDA